MSGINVSDEKTKEEIGNVLRRFKHMLGNSIDSEKPMKEAPARDEFVGTPKARPRRFIYHPEHAEFAKTHIAKLLRLGCVERAHNPPFSFPFLVVKKTDGTFRGVIDLRAYNDCVKAIQVGDADYRLALLRMRGSKCFATLDLADAFWQVPLADSQVYIQTNDGVYRCLRVPQGARNATAHLHNALVQVLDELIGNGVELYVDDLLLHHETEDGLLELLERVFSRFEKFGVVVKLKKSVFFVNVVRWCGLLLSATGFKKDPKNLFNFMRVDAPKNAQELQQVLGQQGLAKIEQDTKRFFGTPLEERT